MIPIPGQLFLVTTIGIGTTDQKRKVSGVLSRIRKLLAGNVVSFMNDVDFSCILAEILWDALRLTRKTPTRWNSIAPLMICLIGKTVVIPWKYCHEEVATVISLGTDWCRFPCRGNKFAYIEESSADGGNIGRKIGTAHCCIGKSETARLPGY